MDPTWVNEFPDKISFVLDYSNVKLSHVEYGSKYPSTPRFSRN